MLKKFFIAYLFTTTIAFANVFSQPATIEKVVSELPQFENVKCKFKQERTIPNSSTVLKSSGEFEFIKNEGVVFKTTYPIQSTSSYKAGNNKQVNDIILAMSNKNYSKIKKEFDLYLERSGNNWTLALKPKKGSKTEKHLKNIVIQGQKNINSITIDTKESGKTVMTFNSD